MLPRSLYTIAALSSAILPAAANNIVTALLPELPPGPLTAEVVGASGLLTSYVIDCPTASTFGCYTPLTAVANPYLFQNSYTNDGYYVSQACSIFQSSSVDCNVFVSESGSRMTSTSAFSPVPLRELTITATDTGDSLTMAMSTPDTTSAPVTETSSSSTGGAATTTVEQTTFSSSAGGKLTIFSWVWGSMVLVLATIYPNLSDFNLPTSEFTSHLNISLSLTQFTMTSDDQFFFDYLASIPHDVRRYSIEVADSIDRQVDHAARLVRDTLSNQSWLPSQVRPSSRTPPSVQSPQSLTNRLQDWVVRNRAWSAAILAFVGTSCVLYFGNKKFSGKRRRARRAGNGARKEIVVVAGSPHEPTTKAIATDLERRGYIVYVTVSSADEEHLIQAENRMDLRPLWLDITGAPSSPSEIHPSLNEIHTLITQPQWPMPGVPPHTCQLSGVILVPSPNYVSGPAATIPPSAWADTVNTRLLSPILTTQLFLPLLTLRNTNSTIVFVYPSISSSLSAPFTSPEVTTARALSGFATSLRRELHLLQQNNIDVVELKLGNIDLGPQYRNAQSRITGTEVLAWSAEQRALYGSQYLNSIQQRPVASAGPSTIRGAPARTLHFAVQDALEPMSKDMFGRKRSKNPVIYVGRGARTYSLIGEWVPAGLVGWMLGLRNGRGAPVESGSGSGSETSWEKV